MSVDVKWTMESSLLERCSGLVYPDHEAIASPWTCRTQVREVRSMNAVTHEVQACLGIEVEDESVLISHLPDDLDGPGEIDRAIVWNH